MSPIIESPDTRANHSGVLPEVLPLIVEVVEMVEMIDMRGTVDRIGQTAALTAGHPTVETSTEVLVAVHLMNESSLDARWCILRQPRGTAPIPLA